jgi:hypothetical protein
MDDASARGTNGGEGIEHIETTPIPKINTIAPAPVSRALRIFYVQQHSLASHRSLPTCWRNEATFAANLWVSTGLSDRL